VSHNSDPAWRRYEARGSTIRPRMADKVFEGVADRCKTFLRVAEASTLAGRTAPLASTGHDL
jgi:hypothetical protein